MMSCFSNFLSFDNKKNLLDKYNELIKYCMDIKLPLKQQEVDLKIQTSAMQDELIIVQAKITNKNYKNLLYCTYTNGGSYEGESKDETRHGIGIYIYPSSTVYYGEWAEGFRKGLGICKFEDSKNIYTGNWESGMRNGVGVFNYSISQSQYVGYFFDDKRYGFGICYLKNQDKYIGFWQNDHRNGVGIFNSNDGYEYTGNWKDDMRNGIGMLCKDENIIYVGSFQNNKKHGEGFLHDNESHNIIQGKFENDDLIETVQVILMPMKQKIKENYKYCDTLFFYN